MGPMSQMREQDADQTSGEHGIKKLPTFLSKVQRRSPDPCKTVSNYRIKAARRQDAELMPRFSGASLCVISLLKGGVIPALMADIVNKRRLT